MPNNWWLQQDDFLIILFPQFCWWGDPLVMRAALENIIGGGQKCRTCTRTMLWLWLKKLLKLFLRGPPPTDQKRKRKEKEINTCLHIGSPNRFLLSIVCGKELLNRDSSGLIRCCSHGESPSYPNLEMSFDYLGWRLKHKYQSVPCEMWWNIL